MTHVSGDERSVLLTLARMGFTAETGELCSKNIAAVWALSKMPPNLAPLLRWQKRCI
ncbi:aminoglycoside adenylyltransferase domain-containing protein [Hungatella hathewayi]|uniref:aminoglycoside adenylyltransferase domain-containing protein n=1 Tax=Hungatella hathewayi TaxID=154046 RepID=UPI003567A3A6